jgi:Flp pilus assembly pilin Flp
MYGRPGMGRFYDFWRDQDGQDIMEYSLLITFIAIACLALMTTPEPAIQGLWSTSSNTLAFANTNLSGS